MPDRNAHLKRAHDNEEFARSLELDQGFYVDWAITFLFYAAVHYIDAYLALKPYHPPSHHHRDTEIQRNGSLNQIWNDYRRLKDLSESARYEIANYHRSDFRAVEARFGRIKNYVSSRL